MALVTINGVSVISGVIRMPLRGAWTADLVIDQPDGSGFVAGTQVTIASEGSFSLAGTVAPNLSGAYLDAVHVLCVGGAGGMAKPATARSYVQPGAFVRDVLNGLCSDSGETMSATSDASFTSSNLAAWSVISDGNVSQALTVLLEFVAPTLNWRFMGDGTLWIGAETWDAGSGTFEILSQDPSKATFQLGTDAPWIMPGMALDGVGNINRVEHTIASDNIRSRVVTDAGYDDSWKGMVSLLVAQQVSSLDYHALYIAQVVSQSADFTTVDIQPQGARNQTLLGGLQRVPVRAGTGIKMQFSPGATVLLGWDGGDPRSPFVIGGLSGDSLLGVTIGDAAGDSIAIANGIVTVKAAGVTVLQASATSVGIGLVRALQVLVLGATDGVFGVPVLQNPAATASIVKAG